MSRKMSSRLWLVGIQGQVGFVAEDEELFCATRPQGVVLAQRGQPRERERERRRDLAFVIVVFLLLSFTFLC